MVGIDHINAGRRTIRPRHGTRRLVLMRDQRSFNLFVPICRHEGGQVVAGRGGEAR
jgi:phenylpropionate dioxygenase-like ring-hydroxylating dioxygenase large terminal subunit